jgi:PKD repeat protein
VVGAFDYSGRWQQGSSGILYTVNGNSDAVVNYSAPGSISSLVLSRDGTMMAYGAENYTYVSSPWEQQSSHKTSQIIIDRQSKRFWESNEVVRSFTPDNYYALILRDTSLYFWDFRHNSITSPFPSHIRGNWYFLTTINHLLVQLNNQHTAGIYDIATDTWQHFFDGPRASSFSVSPMADAFASGTYDGKVLLWNISGTFTPMPTRSNFSVADTVGRLDQPITFRNISFPVQESTKFFWDFGDGNTSREFHATHIYRAPGRYTVRLVATSLNQRSDTLIREQYIVIPEISKDIVWRKKLSEESVQSVVYAQDGTTIVSAQGHPILTNAGDGQKIRSWPVPCSYVSVFNNTSLLMGYTTFPWSNNPEQSCMSWLGKSASDILTPYCNLTNTALMFDMDNGDETTDESTSMTSSRNGSIIAFGSSVIILSQEGNTKFFSKATGTLTIVDKERDTTIYTSSLMNHPITVHCVMPDNTHLVTTEFDNQNYNGKVMIRDIPTLQTVDSLAVSVLSPIYFSPTDPDILASTTFLWNRRTGKVDSLPLQYATDFSFTPDGRYLIAVFANEDSAVAILDIVSRQWKYWYISHPSKQMCIAIAPNGRHFATGASDGSVTVWNIPEEFWPDSTTSTTPQQPEFSNQIQISISPNPMSTDGCTIDITQYQTAYTTITISDLFGRTIAVLFEDILAEGEHSIRWGGKTTTGATIAPGSYFCQVRMNNHIETYQLLLLR